MNNRLLKHFIYLFVLLTQIQGFANLFLDNFKQTKINLNQEFVHPYFKINNIVEEQIFSIRAEVINNGCFTGSSNLVEVKFILKNISGANQSIVGRTSGSGKKIRIVNSSGLNLSGFSGTNNIYTDSKILAPNEELIITGTFYDLNYLYVEQVIGNVTFRYANFNYSGGSNSQIGNDIQNLQSTATINRIPDAPGNKTVVKKFSEQYTIAQAAGVTSNVGNYRFYVDNVQVNSNFIIDLTQAENYYKTYTYTVVNTYCESAASIIRFRPAPGLISTAQTEVCEGSNVIINNARDGEGSGSYVLKYSWEVSYDNGVTWGTPDDGSLDTDGQKSTTISNITSNLWIRRKAHERPINTRVDYYTYSNIIKLTVSKNKLIFPQGISNTVAVKLDNQTNLAAVSLPVLTSEITGATIEYRNAAGTLIATNPTAPVSVGNLALGDHLFEVKAKNTLPGNVVCETVEIIRVTVYDARACNDYTKRTFGTAVKGWTSGLSGYRELENVVDGNRASYGEINGGVVLLGIGTVGMDIYFTKPDGSLFSGDDLKGKRVVIKIGEQYSGLKVAGGLSVRAINTSQPVNDLSLTPNLVGATYGVKGGVLDALKGDNVFEFSFIPASSLTSSATPVGYNGVRIQLGSLIGVADLATVFYAYIEEESNITTDFGGNTQSYCQAIGADIRVSPPTGMAYPTYQNDIDISSPQLGPITNTNFKLNRSVEDAFWGNYSEVLNVASSLNPVIYPYYAVDDDYDSYSIFNTTLGVLNAQFLQAKLRQRARLGDQVQILLSYPNISVLKLNLLQLGNFKIVYYLNGAKVGEEKLEEFRVMDIGLFRFRDKRRAILSKPVTFMFDKIELTQFSAVSVNLGEGLRIHDIRINPLNAFVGMKDPKEVTQICATSNIAIQQLDPCTEYQLSFARVTEFGSAYLNDDDTPLLDYKGRPIRSIYQIADIPNSNLTFINNDPTGSIAYFAHNRSTLFTGPDYDGKLLLKIQTIRQGCPYGDPQYLRIDLENCISGITNPILINSARY